MPMSRLVFVSGARPDLVKVEDGTEFLKPARVQQVNLRRARGEVDTLLSRYDYAAAEKVIAHYLQEESDEGTPASQWLLLCRAFDARDRFDHAEALSLLKRAQCPGRERHLEILGLLKKKDDSPDWKSPRGYLLAGDIMANAVRRASQGRYDDAVARHYRAVELVAQTFLWNNCRNIDSGRTEEAQAPDSLDWKENVPKWPCKPGLIRSWGLAAALDDNLREFTLHGKVRCAPALKRETTAFSPTEPFRYPEKSTWRTEREEWALLPARRWRPLPDSIPRARRLLGDPMFPTSLPVDRTGEPRSTA